MRTGLLLPLYDAPWQHDLHRLHQVAELGFTGVWTRDVPLTENDGVDRAVAGDPVADLAHAMGTGLPFEEFGTAILCAGYRHPLSMARSVVMLQQISGNRLVLGIGAGSRSNVNALYGLDREGRRENLIHTVRTLDDVLRRGGRLLPDTVRFETPPRFQAPPMLLASGDPTVLTELAPLLDGHMVPGASPEALDETGPTGPAGAARLPSTMQLSLAVNTADRSMPLGVRDLGRISVVEVGALGVGPLLRRYAASGLDRLVLHLPFDDLTGRQLTCLAAHLRELTAAVPAGAVGARPLAAAT
ncbi:LLM class flavin-dependent oxidoreductase [Streptacidiphilus melanogenes]|uniref:LLM class flavin-dependent oxidoreductase n=1 Tax=Streptacidiphilus melanogenes TaxID=411235 RepID=UPI0005A91469|nr:LLM class flavin-dependent oxidoreductase [Streptacidiphilus melanogenes]